MEEQVVILNETLAKMTAQQGLPYVAKLFENHIVFSSSFGIEDQVITQMIASQQLNVEIFTLDTGRMFTETYTTWNETLNKYKIKIKAYYPNETALQTFVQEKGPSSFYESVDNRKQCCFIRKVEPLKRALINNKLWITGIRAEQSTDRGNDNLVEWDANNNILKYHPLLHWTFDHVKNYVAENEIPVNPLHSKGFVSIGCQPCTRAIRPGEDFRAGRWWWEDKENKECGLHVH